MFSAASSSPADLVAQFPFNYSLRSFRYPSLLKCRSCGCRPSSQEPLLFHNPPFFFTFCPTASPSDPRFPSFRNCPLHTFRLFHYVIIRSPPNTLSCFPLACLHLLLLLRYLQTLAFLPLCNTFHKIFVFRCCFVCWSSYLSFFYRFVVF